MRLEDEYPLKKMGLFKPDTTVFKDEFPLRENYQPDKLQERDEELQEYKRALQPVINDSPPKNILLYGKTGVGKTVATNYLLNHLEQDAREYGVNLFVIKQPCNNLSSSYQVAINLVNQLRGPESQVSTTGYPQQDVFNMLYRELEQLGGVVLIVLDEIDNIGNDDDLLYELPRAEANGYLENVWPGIIGISNDFTFRDNLSPKVKDTLCEEEIHFPPYDANELQNILEDRAQKAFHDGVLTDEVIPLCSAFAAQDSGSARQGLRLVYKSGEFARDTESPKVTEDHVRRAQTELEQGQLEEGMRDLTTQGHLVLSTICHLEVNHETPAKTKLIYQRYQRISEVVGVESLGERRIRDHLSELALYRILAVNERNDGIHGGSYHEYQLNVDLKSAINVLSDISRLDDLPDILRQKAESASLI